MSKTYEGRWLSPNEVSAQGECLVKVNGKVLDPGASQKVYNHSPTGYSWGYGGSGPAQLALAILLDHFSKGATKGEKYRQAKQQALTFHQDFKVQVVACWPQEEGWSITTTEIDQVINQIKEERR
jgi:hypothetical protein